MPRDGWPHSVDVDVRYGDLDVNVHVNNVKFAEWAMIGRVDYFLRVNACRPGMVGQFTRR